jgi:phosphoribosylformylglycinamidine synthase subunit PurS
MLARIHVTLKPGVNDPQGLAIAGGLRQLGFSGVEEVRAGRYLEVRLSALDRGTAERAVEEMCQRLLANPVIERYDYEVTEGDSPAVEEEIEETLEEEA